MLIAGAGVTSLPLPAVEVERTDVIRVQPVNDPGRFENPWPASWEAAYDQRVTEALAKFTNVSNRTAGEHEKWSIPTTMGTWYNTPSAEAITALQTQDLESKRDHQHTHGIDLYWCFTLKGQVAKWFTHKDRFTPEYQRQFSKAIHAWTESDPRPSLEYVLLLDSADAEVREWALQQLKLMFRNVEQLHAMADEAAAEKHPNKQRFAAYIKANAEKIGGEYPDKDPAKWRAWWNAINAGDWMVFEEYERRVNPNPHLKYGIGTGPVGAMWNPETRGMRADARNTDNLRGMRETAVYLFAEASGNELIRKVYKEKHRLAATRFFEIGNGEWDSEGYLGHTIAAYTNLFAFAQDEDVKGYAKAILDYCYISSAAKYEQGTWGGPLVRDYGNHKPFSTSAAVMWLYAGDASASVPKAELEYPPMLASGYRPPAAAVALARGLGVAGKEMLAARPNYQSFLPGLDEVPEYHETWYQGSTFHLGTMVEGHGYNRNGFKLVVHDSQDLGAGTMVPTSGKKAKTAVTDTGGGDAVAQYRHLALYLNRKGNLPMRWLFPDNVGVTDQGDIRLLQAEKTWVAVIPVNLQWEGPAQPLKSVVKKAKKTGKGSVGDSILVGHAGKGVAGFAVVVGEQSTHGSFEDFAQKVSKEVSLKVADGRVTLTDGERGSVAMAFGDSRRPAVWRNGQAHDWVKDHRVQWQGVGSEGPITAGWRQRTIAVHAGGFSFEGSIANDGTYTWSETLPTE
jgi:hypothetical protein